MFTLSQFPIFLVLRSPCSNIHICPVIGEIMKISICIGIIFLKSLAFILTIERYSHYNKKPGGGCVASFTEFIRELMLSSLPQICRASAGN